MKKIILCLLLILAFALPCCAGTNAYIAGCDAGGSSCTQLTVGTQDQSKVIGNASTTCYAFRWVPSQTTTIKRLYFDACQNNSPTNNLTVSILTDVSHGATGTVIANGTSGTVASSTLNACATLAWSYVTFATAPSVTGSSTYYVAMCADAADNTNTVSWGYDADGNGTTDNTGYYTTAIGQNWSVELDHVGPVIWTTSCDEAKP